MISRHCTLFDHVISNYRLILRKLLFIQSYSISIYSTIFHCKQYSVDIQHQLPTNDDWFDSPNSCPVQPVEILLLSFRRISEHFRGWQTMRNGCLCLGTGNGMENFTPKTDTRWLCVVLGKCKLWELNLCGSPFLMQSVIRVEITFPWN